MSPCYALVLTHHTFDGERTVNLQEDMWCHTKALHDSAESKFKFVRVESIFLRWKVNRWPSSVECQACESQTALWELKSSMACERMLLQIAGGGNLSWSSDTATTPKDGLMIMIMIARSWNITGRLPVTSDNLIRSVHSCGGLDVMTLKGRYSWIYHTYKTMSDHSIIEGHKHKCLLYP